MDLLSFDLRYSRLGGYSFSPLARLGRLVSHLGRPVLLAFQLSFQSDTELSLTAIVNLQF